MTKPDPSDYTLNGNKISGLHGKTVKRLAAAGMLLPSPKEPHTLTPKGVAWFALEKGKRFKWDDLMVTRTPEEAISKDKTTGDWFRNSLTPGHKTYKPIGYYPDERTTDSI